MKKLGNNESELKKSVAHKKECSSFVISFLEQTLEEGYIS